MVPIVPAMEPTIFTAEPAAKPVVLFIEPATEPSYINVFKAVSKSQTIPSVLLHHRKQ